MLAFGAPRKPIMSVLTTEQHALCLATKCAKNRGFIEFSVESDSSRDESLINKVGDCLAFYGVLVGEFKAAMRCTNSQVEFRRMRDYTVAKKLTGLALEFLIFVFGIGMLPWGMRNCFFFHVSRITHVMPMF